MDLKFERNMIMFALIYLFVAYMSVNFDVTILIYSWNYSLYLFIPLTFLIVVEWKRTVRGLQPGLWRVNIMGEDTDTFKFDRALPRSLESKIVRECASKYYLLILLPLTIHKLFMYYMKDEIFYVYPSDSFGIIGYSDGSSIWGDVNEYVGFFVWNKVIYKGISFIVMCIRLNEEQHLIQPPDIPSRHENECKVM